MRSLPKGVLCTAAFVNVSLILGSSAGRGDAWILSGVGIVAADIGLQLTLVAIGLWGPVSLNRLGDAGCCLAVGAVFALTYYGYW